MQRSMLLGVTQKAHERTELNAQTFGYRREQYKQFFLSFE